MRHALLVLWIVAAPVLGQVKVENAWARATAPGAKMAAGYVMLRNSSKEPDRLVAASSPRAQRVEMHVHVKDGEIMRMREVKGFDLPPGGGFELKPGGAHLMFVDIKRPFSEGERVPVKLRFQKAGEVAVEFNVGRLGESGAHKGH